MVNISCGMKFDGNLRYRVEIPSKHFERTATRPGVGMLDLLVKRTGHVFHVAGECEKYAVRASVRTLCSKSTLGSVLRLPCGLPCRPVLMVAILSACLLQFKGMRHVLRPDPFVELFRSQETQLQSGFPESQFLAIG